TEAPPRPALTPTERRNRERMLQKVRDFWVKGVLEKSLYAEVRLELGLEYRPGAVENPWDTVLQHAQYGDYQLPPSAKAADVFHDLNGELLILGQPGSGKTTTLLELARDLINWAEPDETLPMPVIFNLSSWAQERKPLADWLAGELNTKYQVPKKVAQEWIKTDTLTLLLDGLDEVAETHRNACVAAINAYRAEHGFVDLVVCSRIEEYDQLSTKLNLQGAIVLKPLTMEQIKDYLTVFGDKTITLRKLLEDKSQLFEIAQSPLMLSIMIMAYQVENMPPDAAIVGRGLVGRMRLYDPYKLLFDLYVKHMFKRRVPETRYTLEQTQKWLSWLARDMVKFEQTTFYIEGLQPTWLKTHVQRRQYRIGNFLASGPVIGLVVGLAGGLVGGLIYGAIIGFGVGLVVGLAVGAVNEIEAAERLTWRLNRLRLVIALLFGLAIGLAIGLVYGLAIGLVYGLAIGLVYGLAIGLRTVEHVEARIQPNQGIRRSARNALLIGLAYGLAYGLTFGLAVLVVGLIYGLISELAVVMVVGLVMGGGGDAVVQHLTLRFIIMRAGYTPWNYARFLDFCAERVFLRKVGGGYIFVHRLLLDYFAGLAE
ncbi:MAG TPA: NACHT domain-containing protein, partial [Phototrophicaceae bacterium]|nr:NACHT domain-containing protein [Phototrophicaceae bacterium]